jgi:hypothetical protein
MPLDAGGLVLFAVAVASAAAPLLRRRAEPGADSVPSRVLVWCAAWASSSEEESSPKEKP